MAGDRARGIYIAILYKFIVNTNLQFLTKIYYLLFIDCLNMNVGLSFLTDDQIDIVTTYLREQFCSKSTKVL